MMRLKYGLVGWLFCALGVAWANPAYPVIKVYSAAMLYHTLTIEVLSADLAVIFDNQPDLRVELSGSGAAEFKHAIVYTAKTAGLMITEDWALSQRVSALMESKAEEKPSNSTIMTVRLPATMRNSVIVLKSQWGAVNVKGGGQVLQQSLSAESLHGPITIEGLRGLRTVLKTGNGAITVTESFFQFLTAQTINGAITLQLLPQTRGLRLSVAQVAGGVYVNDVKMRAVPFMRSLGQVLAGSGNGADAELELRTGYGIIRIGF